MKTSQLIAVTACLAVAGGLAYRFQAGQGKPQDPPKPAVTAVELAPVSSGAVALLIDATGNVSPLQSVDVKPQVNGVVQQVLIKEGQAVKAGEPLFRLEDGAEQAALAKARALLLKDQAQLADAVRNLKRSESLARDNFLSPSAVDTAQSTVDALRATVASDQAAITAAQVDLGFKSIRAAIPGRAGAINVYPGSVVQPAMATAMVTLAQIDPIAVTFTLPENALPRVFAARTAGTLKVGATLPGSDKRFEGRITLIDNQVDSKSGTLKLKAEFPNPDAALWPGLYVNVKLDAGIEQGVLTVPATGVQTGPESKFAYVVGQDMVARAQPIELIGVRDGLALVRGLQPGQQVVVNGALNLKPDGKVKLAKTDKGQP